MLDDVIDNQPLGCQHRHFNKPQNKSNGYSYNDLEVTKILY